MIRVIKVSEILKELNLTSGYTERVTTILKSSQEYGEKTKTSILGTTVDGEFDEVIEFVDKKLHEKRETSLYYDTVAGEKKALNHEIKAKKEALSSGDEYYEYKTVIIQDSEFLGKTDAEMIELTLNKYALEGWRLKAAITNEIGHNRAVVVNATINNTILILERLVTKG